MDSTATTAECFIHEDFLLENEYSRRLFHDYASEMPIIDYHCHLPPNEIAQDRVFENLTQVWINGDHYKWRAMRTFGIDEQYITGDAPDQDKFTKWAETVPHTLRNPLYHWTHLELKRYFDIDLLLNERTAIEIYQETLTKLNTKDYSCQNLLRKNNVEVVCTTEDPLDSLTYHKALVGTDMGFKMHTAFRPDKAILIGSKQYNEYLDQLENVCGKSINNFQTLCDALHSRVEYFHENGCRLSDHGLNYIPFVSYKEEQIDEIFIKRRAGKDLTIEEEEKFQTAILLFLSECYHEKGWVQQFHLGALRNNNTRMHRMLGPDTGWDSIGDFQQAPTLSRFLDALDTKDKLAKTILYNLNPADNEVMATMIGNYNDGSVKGKVQLGSGWWFLDQKDGIIKQLNALSNMGLISCFVGMLTDSRSFMSFPRHEYFRRVLCNLLGQEMQSGELPLDYELVGQLVKNICCFNARSYFDF